MNLNDVIIRPVITEKSMHSASVSKFTFIVSMDAKKEDIKKAVEVKFNVHVEGVDTMIVKGKTHRTGKRRAEVVRQSMKKAVVSAKKGEKIDLFDLGA